MSAPDRVGSKLVGVGGRTIERRAIVVHAGLAVGFGIALIGRLAATNGVIATDFTAFWTGWWLILHGQSGVLYDATAQRAAQQMIMAGFQFQGGLMAFLNPPHVALAGLPFGWLADHAGERVAFLVWTAGNIGLLVTLDRWLREAWGASTGPTRWVITTALVAFYPVFQTLNIGQTSLLLGVAAMGLYRAVASSQPVAGAAWLLALTVKPQLMPAVLVFLLARRCWRMLAFFAAMMLTAIAATAAALGTTIWTTYLLHLRELEPYWGTGTPGHMRNIRGLLTRVVGSIGQPAIDATSYGVWIAGTLLVAGALFAWRLHKATDIRPGYSLALGVGLLVSPHLFVQDVVVWTVPLTLFAAALRDGGRRWQPFVTFALCWPVLFAVGHFADIRTGDPALSVETQVAALIAATAMIAFGARQLAVSSRGAPVHA